MGREMREPVIMPDIYGLPVYGVDRCIKQRVGDKIHLLKGRELLGQVIWSHIEVWTLADVLKHAREATDLAREALAIEGGMESSAAH